jgi:hypothetical protein
MFIAHHIAEWLGIPAGIVIAAMFILRKKGRALRTRRQQAHAGRVAGGQEAKPDRSASSSVTSVK